MACSDNSPAPSRAGAIPLAPGRRAPARRRFWLLSWLLGVTLLGLGAWTTSAQARSDPASPVLATPWPRPASQGTENDACLACHGPLGQTTALPSGELLYISIDPVAFAASVHGQEGLQCLGCHAGHDVFPHPPVSAQTRREYNLDRYTTCQECHPDKYRATLDSVHQKALAAGNQEAAICTDCHGPHTNIHIEPVPRTAIARTCEKCHSVIYQTYLQSVHGAALTAENNPDVPTCIDCHGVHDVQGPSTGPFHLFSPTICAECHADPELMANYGLSTHILETYVADFHGTTVLLFEKIAPDQETNKPVCIDCHGVHDIRSTDDPESTVIQENLLATCRRCHPDATASFPASWLGHYPPDPQHHPIVYFVGVFYKVFIPLVLGSMGIFVVTDVVRGLRQRRERRHG